jgi:hypothetical protein
MFNIKVNGEHHILGPADAGEDVTNADAGEDVTNNVACLRAPHLREMNIRVGSQGTRGLTHRRASKRHELAVGL